MPQLIPIVVYAAATYFTTAGVATVLAIVAAFAVSAYQQSSARRKARQAFNDSLTDRAAMIRSGIAPRRVVVGRAKVSGPIIYVTSTGDKDQFLHLVICLAGHEIDDVVTIYFNEESIGALDSEGFVTTGRYVKRTNDRLGLITTNSTGVITLPQVPTSVQGVTVSSGPSGYENSQSQSVAFTRVGAVITVTNPPAGSQRYTVQYTTGSSEPHVRVKIHKGQPGQVADPDLVAESGGEWTSAHRGDGIAYLYVRLQYDLDIFPNSVPNISATVRGAKVFDPRTSTTAWSDNSALITAWWLRQQEFGLRAPATAIVNAELSAEASICDETINLGGGLTQRRYTTNGSFTLDTARRDILEMLVAPMAGAAPFVQGRWYVKAGAYEPPTLQLDEDDFAPGDIEILPKPSRRELFNAATGTYIERASGYIERQFPIVSNPTYQAQDGGEQVTVDIPMPMVDEGIRCQRLAKIAIEQSRQGMTISATFSRRAYDCKQWDTISISSRKLGWTNKPFVVLERDYMRGEANRIKIVARETASGVWAWNFGQATTVDLAPNTNLPNPTDPPPALTGVTAQTGGAHVLKMPDGTEIIRARVQWTASTSDFVRRGGHIEIQHQTDDDTLWQDNARVAGNATFGYASPIDTRRLTYINVRQVNVLGIASVWTSVLLAATTGDITPPINVAGLAADVDGRTVIFEWTANTIDRDYMRTEARLGSWLSPQKVLMVNGNRLPWTADGPGVKNWFFRHMDRTGIYSAASTSVSFTISDTANFTRAIYDIVSFKGGGPFFAGLRFLSNGTTEQADETGQWGPSIAWFLPATSGIGSSYWIRFTVVSGTPDTGTFGTWQALSATRTVAESRTSGAFEICRIRYEISSNSSGTRVVSSGYIDLEA